MIWVVAALAIASPPLLAVSVQRQPEVSEAFEADLLKHLLHEAHFRQGYQHVGVERLEAMVRGGPLQPPRSPREAATAVSADLLLELTLSMDRDNIRINTQARLLQLKGGAPDVDPTDPALEPGSVPKRPDAPPPDFRVLDPEPEAPGIVAPRNGGRSVAEALSLKLFGPRPAKTAPVAWYSGRIPGAFLAPGLGGTSSVIAWPPQAQIKWKGELIPLEPGRGLLEISAPGFVTFKRDLVIESGTAVYVNLEQQTATLKVQIPTGSAEAWLEIDGTMVGALPRTIVLSSGAHKAQARIQGVLVGAYKFNLAPDESHTWQVEGRTYPVPLAASTLISPFFTFKNVGANAFINGVLVGRTPLKLQLNPGAYALTLRVLGAVPKKTIITVPSPTAAPVDLKLDPNTVAGAQFVARHPAEAKILCEQWLDRNPFEDGTSPFIQTLFQLIPLIRPFAMLVPWRANNRTSGKPRIAHGGSWWWQAQAWLIDAALVSGLVMWANDNHRDLGRILAAAAYVGTPLLDTLWTTSILPRRNRALCLERLEALTQTSGSR